MLSAIQLAVSQLGDPAFRSVMIKSLGLTLLVFILLGFGVSEALNFVPQFEWSWVNTVISFFSAFGFVLGGFFLFPLVISALIGLFLDDISDAVERKYYPNDDPAEDIPLLSSIWDAIKFLGLVALCNIVALPLYFIPGINLFVYYLLNGYLISREYFQMVAIRHHDTEEVTRLRKTNATELYLLGIVVAFCLTVPILNLITPIIATAAMVHLYKKRYRRIAPGKGVIVR
ncbi:MAG: sulfate transporter family protein [Alphaproteobacteria bacterium]|nr:MAG: sulfate transporter family protein [Alphaproteobacteria bacterium]